MLLVVAGGIDHEKTNRLVAERFAGLQPGPEQLPSPAHEPPIAASRTAHLAKDLNQHHLLVGVPTVSMKHGDRSSLKVIERVLGMGGSARLYQRLREQDQLVYSVHTVTAHYEDAGYFAVHTACDPTHAHRVQQIILQEWERLCDRGVSGDELIAAKGNYGGTLARRFETNLAVAGIFGVEGLLHRVEPFQEAVQRIDAVQREDVQRVAQRYLRPQRMVRVSVGREPPRVDPRNPC
jgi:predicted Zn-dependent peptidase